MKLELTKDLPKSVGHYWYTDMGEHTPCVLEVTKYEGKLWAQNSEFTFRITKKDCEGTLWCRIPNPTLNGEEIEPSSF